MATQLFLQGCKSNKLLNHPNFGSTSDQKLFIGALIVVKIKFRPSSPENFQDIIVFI